MSAGRIRNRDLVLPGPDMLDRESLPREQRACVGYLTPDAHRRRPGRTGSTLHPLRPLLVPRHPRLTTTAPTATRLEVHDAGLLVGTDGDRLRLARRERVPSAGADRQVGNGVAAGTREAMDHGLLLIHSESGRGRARRIPRLD